jgi:hypothetical protein
MGKLSFLAKVFILALVASCLTAWFAYTEHAKAHGNNNSLIVMPNIDELVGIDNITITSNERTLEFVKVNNSWHLTNNYPLNDKLINKLLLQLSNLKFVDKKTSNPENFPQLQLDAPASQNSKAIRIALKASANESAVVDWIIGKKINVTVGGVDTSRIFIRSSSDSQSFIVVGDLDIDVKMQYWLQQPLSDLGTIASIRGVYILDYKNNNLHFIRKSASDNFTLINQQKYFDHKKLTNFISDLVALECSDVVVKSNIFPTIKNLAGLNAQDSASGLTKFYMPHKEVQVVLETFDDLQYTFKVSAVGGKIIAQIQSDFIKSFPNQYSMVTKPIQRALLGAGIKQQYLFELSAKDFNMINSVQGDILNG